MTGRVIIVTGANCGIGYEAAKYLCDEGNDVILACRNEEKGKAAVGKILKANPNALATFMQLDLADLSSVRQFVEEFHQSDRKLHVLVNNAGVYPGPNDPRRFTKNNFELAMGTNHLGHFLLTNLLLEDLRKSSAEAGESRIVVVSSLLHDGNMRNKNHPNLDLEDIFLGKPGAYNGDLSYKNSKLANIFFTYELAKKLEGSGVTVNCMSPGFIPSTELVRNATAPIRFFTRYVLGGILRFTKVTETTAQGARAVVDLATSEKFKGVSGKFIRSGQEIESSAESKNEDTAKQLWELSCRYCHMEGYESLDAPEPPPEEPKVTATPSKDKKKSKKSKEAKGTEETQTEVKQGEGQSEVVAEGQAGVKIEVETAEENETKEVKDDTVEEKEETPAEDTAVIEPEMKGKVLDASDEATVSAVTAAQ